MSEESSEIPDAPNMPRRFRRRAVLAWLWVVLWAGVIWTLGGEGFSADQTQETLLPFFRWLFDGLDYRAQYRLMAGIRKAAHLVEYAILALLTFRAALIAARRDHRWAAVWVALFIVSTLATADELRQGFTASRTGSAVDVLIDITGGLIALIGAVYVSRRIRATTPSGSSA